MLLARFFAIIEVKIVLVGFFWHKMTQAIDSVSVKKIQACFGVPPARLRVVVPSVLMFVVVEECIQNSRSTAGALEVWKSTSDDENRA